MRAISCGSKRRRHCVGGGAGARRPAWPPRALGARRGGAGVGAATTTAVPTLLYRGSRDGLTGEAFHRQCDDYEGAGTVTVVRSKAGYVFGGYARASWKWDAACSGTYEYVVDRSAFIFSLTNPVNVPAKYEQKPDTLYSICRNPNVNNRGPCFGGGRDVGAYFSEQSYTNFPHSYVDTTGRGNSTFNGEINYQIDEIEVWGV